ncbi:hypothetical protein D3C78_537330 [compost metagenome]
MLRGRATSQAPRANTGASALHSRAKPSRRGSTQNCSAQPSTALPAAPTSSCQTSRRGLRAVEDSAETIAAVSTQVPPLGQALAIQKAPRARISRALRIPATAAAMPLARGVKPPCHCSRAWWWSSSEAWVSA